MREKTLMSLDYTRVLEMLAKNTQTSLGRELALNLRPISDREEIEYMLSETSEALSFIYKKGMPSFDGIYDITGTIKKMEMGMVPELHEFLHIASTLKAVKRLKLSLKEEKGEFKILGFLSNSLAPLSDIEKKISSIVISEEDVADDSSPELYSIRRQIKNATNEIREKLYKLINSPSYQKYLQEPIISIRGDRYVVPVKQEFRSFVPGLIHDQSASGATLFIEPLFAVELNNKIRELRIKEKHEIERILKNLAKDIIPHLDDLRNNLTIIAKLDFIFAKGKLSYDMEGIAPRLNDNGFISITRGRHPLIDRDKVVPIDIYLGKSFNVLVITGPNTGGKTVTLKTVGLLVLMAQSGLHIPAGDGTDINVFDEVFVDIGDEQSIEQSLSTFSSHMTNIVSILNSLTPNSLVLLDELGAGTDPVEGAALAVSILEYLISQSIRVIATTHYSELKIYAMTRAGVENASVEFDVETLRPTYRLLIGIPGKSNAFEISKRLGLSEAIIEKAKSFIAEDSLKVEDMLLELDKKRKEIEKDKEEINRIKKELQSLKLEMENEKRRLERDRMKLLKEAKDESRRILENAKREAEEIIKQLKELEKEEYYRERNRLIEITKRRLKEDLEGLEEQEEIIEEIAGEKINVGDTVLIRSLNQKGKVLAISEEHQTAEIQIGIMKVNVNLNEVVKIEEKKEALKTGIPKLTSDKLKTIRSEIDLRGQTLEDALLNTDKYLDDAFLAGLKKVYIIHGKGTGTLRSGISQLLKTHPHVKSFRTGRYDEGGDGVTVVELKS